MNKGNLRLLGNWHQNRVMRDRRKTAAVVLVCGLACLAMAQDDVGTNNRNSHPSKISKGGAASGSNPDSDPSSGTNARETSFNRERGDDRILNFASAIARTWFMRFMRRPGSRTDTRVPTICTTGLPDFSARCSLSREI